MTQKPIHSPSQALNNMAGNNKLLDTLMEKLGLKNDAALALTLEVAPPVISKIRHGRLPIGATILIRAHEATDIAIRELKAIATPAAPEVAV
ncbi:hypothetical protein [Janthinobacterium sp. UMAB-56]|uniref:hypothetical protein n=1 Tax=Janthinobacterium sp. UMAB-56 TaxID=1365361 RepID=UPI001C565322|nr:hypothetical protein [Janthinobacterium sp. UMAB-56]